MEEVNKLRKTCQLLETDIKEVISEIVELEISRETLIEELKEARKALYKAIEKIKQDKARTI